MTEIQKDLFDKLYIELSFIKDGLRLKHSNAIKVDDAYHSIILKLAKSYNVSSVNFADEIYKIKEGV